MMLKIGCLFKIEAKEKRWGRSSAGRTLRWQRRGHGFPPEADPPLGGQIPSAPPANSLKSC